MAANVLNSKNAVRMSVEVVRAFIRLRQQIRAPHRLARKLAELEHVVTGQLSDHDKKIEELFETISVLMGEEDGDPPLKRIGFVP